MTETLQMWWAKLLVPIAFAIISAMVVYFYNHETRTDVIENNVTALSERMNRNEANTTEFLSVLKDMNVSLQANHVAIAEMRASTEAVIERNNRMIDDLLERAKDK